MKNNNDNDNDILTSKTAKIGMTIEHLYNFSHLIFKITMINKENITFENVKTKTKHTQTIEAFKLTRFVPL